MKLSFGRWLIDFVSKMPPKWRRRFEYMLANIVTKRMIYTKIDYVNFVAFSNFINTSIKCSFCIKRTQERNIVSLAFAVS